MLSNKEFTQLRSIYSTCDYDEIGDIETDGFTKNLDNIEFLTDDHPFIFYLNGFLHNLVTPKILHGYYKKDDFILKLYINDPIPSYCKTGIHVAWNNYVNHKGYEGDYHYQVSIYNRYCSELYMENDYDQDPKEFYKWFVGALVENKF